MFRKIFDADGDFGACHSAKSWLESNGFSAGSMQAGAPMGILKGDWLIAKWRNLSSTDRRELHGTLLFRRGGSAIVEIKDEFAEGLS